MKTRQKTKQHLRRQNKRLRGLIWKLSLPILVMLLLCLPILISAWLTARNEPGQPFEVQYAEYYRRITTGRLYMLETQSGKTYRLPWQILENGLREDIQAGIVQEGEILTISTRPGLWQDWIATLSTKDRCYGDLELYEEIKHDRIIRYWTAAGLFLLIGCVLTGIDCLLYRDAIRQALRLRKKYREDLKP